MDCKKAEIILGIAGKKYSSDMIKKAYYKLALQYHPDKGGDETKFKEIHDAYEYLSTQGLKRDPTDSKDVAYSDLIKKMINWMAPGTFNDLFIDTSIVSILKNCEDMSFLMLEQMNLDKALKAYEILKKYSSIFMVSKEMLEKMEKIIQRKMHNDNIYILNPSLKDMMEDKIYKLKIDSLEKEIYFPLWHQKKVLLDNDLSNNIFIVSEPDISDNIYISKNNDIFYSVKVDVNDMLKNEYLDINVGGRDIKIYGKDLVLSTEPQIKKFKQIGILKVNKENMFDQSKRSDIYVEITLSN